VKPETRAQPRPLLVPLALLGIAVVMCWPLSRLWRPELSNLPDASFNVWRLAWVAHQLASDPAHLFEANIFYPAAHALAFSDAMLLLGFMATPLIWAGVHVFVVHNLLVIAAFWTSSYCTYRLCLKLTGDYLAAFIGAMVAGYAPYRFGHIAHLELLWTAFLPMGLASLCAIYERPSLRDASLLAVAVVAQTLCSIYYGIYFVTYLAIAALGLAFARSRAGLVHVGSMIVVAGVIAAVALAPYVLIYRDARALIEERTTQEIERFSAVPTDYLLVSHEHALPFPAAGHAEERSLYPGLIAIALAGLALATRPRISMLYAALTLASVDLSLGLNGLLYPLLLKAIPALASLRAPARFGAFVLLSLSVLTAIGAAQILSSVRSRRRVAVLLVTAMLVEYFAAPLGTRVVPTTAPPLQAWLAQQPKSVIVELPLPVPEALWAHETEYQLMSIYHWHSLANGYSGNAPNDYVRLLNQMRTFPNESSLEALRAKHVRWIVIHQALLEPGVFVDLMEQSLANRGLRSIGTYGDHWGQAIVLELLPTSL